MNGHDDAHDTCPGLRAGPDGLLWTDSLGRVHDLNHAQRVSVGIAAIRLNLCTRTILRRIAVGELYPVLKHNARCVEIYACGLDDYLVRKTRGCRLVGG